MSTDHGIGQRWAIVLTIAVCLGWSRPASAETPFDPLLRQVSPDANVLVMIDAERIRRSPFASDLAAAADGQSGNAHVVSRSEISQILLAARIRGFRESMVDWQTALIQMNSEPSVVGLAANYGGKVEEMGKTEYAVLPYGAVAVATGKTVLAVLTPPDRQQVSRAVRLAGSTKPAALDGYLQSVPARLGVGADALIAIDLEGMFSGSQTLGFIQDCDTFRNKAEQRLGAVHVLDTLRGLTIRVSFRKEARAELCVDFLQPIPDLAPWGKDLLKEVLVGTGAWIDDVDTWDVRQEEKRFILEGTISLSGLRQMFSLVNFPTEVPVEYQPGAKLSPEKEKAAMAKASLARFRACEKLVADLKKDDRARTSRIGESALWFDRYAKMIETLPSLHVDPEVLAYCDDVVLRLRVQATSYRMSSLKVSQERDEPNTFWGYFNNYYGSTYAVWTRTESDADRTRRYERAAAAGSRTEQFQAIADEGTKVRRAMTMKYGAEF